MIFYYVIGYIAVLLAAAGQILLKIGSGKEGTNLGIILLNVWVVLGLGAMVFSILLNVRALSVVPLRDMAFIMPTIYFLVPLFSKIFLKEQLGRRVVIGTLIMITGIILFNLPSSIMF
jgi:drug/metabolite transporter (DMT)-like permease